MSTPAPDAFRGWSLRRQYLRVPGGLFLALPSVATMAALGGLILLLCAALVFQRGISSLVGLIPPLLVYGIALERCIRCRHLPGAPVATLEGEELRLYLPNHLGRVTRIDLREASALSFYGPGRRELAVIHRDGRLSRYYPVWSAGTYPRVRQFLQEELAGRVEVREGAVPGFMEEARGQYEP